MIDPKIIKIGRDPSNDVVMDDISISRFHAEIFVDPEQNVFYSDLTSTYGTMRNGERIREPILLMKGDKLLLGQGQKFDWEKLIFGTSAPEVKEPEAEESWVKRNMDILIIYGLILVMIIILSIIT